MKENTEKTGEKLEYKGQFKKGDDPRRNLQGRPVGSLDFKTKFELFLDKLAKQNDMSPQEIDEQLFSVAFKKAKDGDYQFWRDVHDRIYGKPLQKTDVTSGGMPIIQISEVIANKNDITSKPE